MASIIESELLRQELYQQTFTNLAHLLKLQPRQHKDLTHLLLRYRFNLTPEDDPIFIATSNPEAEQQVLEDCDHFKYPKDLLSWIVSAFQACNQVMAASQIPVDAKVKVSRGHLYYKDLVLKDISNLSRIDAYRAFALQLRYEYLGLGNQGLSRIYKGRRDSATEAFATAFHHYYSNYFSPFPDLEMAFGSLGSFFDSKSFPTEVVVVNPPFDPLLIARCVEKMKEMKEYIFLFTAPDWSDLPALQELEQSYDVIRYRKGRLPFIDLFTERTIFPCDILEAMITDNLDRGERARLQHL